MQHDPLPFWRLPTRARALAGAAAALSVVLLSSPFSIASDRVEAPAEQVDASATPAVSTAALVGETLDPGDPADALIQEHTEGFFTLIKRFEAPLGLRGYLLASQSGQPVVIYTDPAGSNLFVGAIIDAEGQNVATGYLASYLDTQMLPAVFARLDREAAYLEEGQSDAPLIYVMFDPLCPHCADLHAKLRSALAEGAVRVRWIPVDVLGDAPMAAALLDARDAGDAADALAKAFAAQATDVDSAPEPEPSPESLAAASVNAEMIASLGLSATPQILFRARSGSYQVVRGSPAQEELNLLLQSVSPDDGHSSAVAATKHEQP